MNKNAETYLSILKSTLEDGNIHPVPALGVVADGGVHIASLMVDTPHETFMAVKTLMQKQDYTEFFWGLDRMTKPGQGVDEVYSSVFTIFYWTKEWGWQFGLWPYTNNKIQAPDIIWKVEGFWNDRMTAELKEMKL